MPAAEFLPVPRVPRRELRRWNPAMFLVMNYLPFKLLSREYPLFSRAHVAVDHCDFCLMPGTMQDTSQLNLRTASS